MSAILIDDSQLVVATYLRQRQAGADEWSACDAALDAFREKHPELSAEFANQYVADRLGDLEPSRSEW